MKLIVCFLLAFTANMFASIYSQNERFDLDVNNQSVRKVLKTIEENSEFRFFYNDDFVDLDKLVSITVNNESIDNILSRVLNSRSVGYQILENNFVVLTPGTNFQEPEIRGVVTDANTGEPLIGVTIQIQGTMTGTITQADGSYSLNPPSDATTLIFSYVGYTTQTIEIDGRTVIDVVMSEEVTALEEIVVTGYSVERKKDIIGSVAVVDVNSSLTQPSTNIAKTLQGLASGVVSSSDGTPGSQGRLRIRGFGSFGNSEPLYIIDGVPGSAELISTSDIESVQVLKDAASASIYGARAANGVIIITTKKGKFNSNTIVNYNGYYGINYVDERPDLATAKEWGEIYWKSLEGSGRELGTPAWGHPQYGYGPTPIIPEYILVNLAGNRIGGAALEDLKTSDPALFNSYVDPNNYDFNTHQIVKSADTDWWDEVMNSAPVQSHQLSINGGGENIAYSISFNYFDETSTASKYNFYTRYSLRVNSVVNVNPRLRIGENMEINNRKWRDEGTPIKAAYEMHPMIPVYDIMGNPASSAAPGLVSLHTRNPVTEPWRQRFDKNKTTGFFGSVYVELDILKNLTAKSLFGVDYRDTDELDFTYRSYEHYQNETSENLTKVNSNQANWVWTNTLNYSLEIASHNVNILVGSEASEDYYEFVRGNRYGYNIQEDANFLVLASGAGAQTNDGSFNRSRLFSLFGRLDYTFADKYILNTTLRRDGSSKFGENNRYGYFPSVAIGWRISEENFMRNLTWLTDLKLRGSWGIIGNQTGLPVTNQYSTYTASDEYSYSISGSNSNKVDSYSLATIGNPDAKWEKTTTTNIGLDLTVLAGKWSFSGEYFIKETTDLLVVNQAPLTGTMGSQPFVNVGDIENKGIELNVTNRGKVAGNLDYEISVIFSKYKNKVNKVLDNPDAFLIGYNTHEAGPIARTIPGYPIAQFFGYKIDGFINSQQELDAYNNAISSTWLTPAIGRWKIKDVNNDGIVNDDDRIVLGSPHPDFQISFNISLKYRNFDFYSFFFWNQGGLIYNYPLMYTDFHNYAVNRSSRMLHDSWTPENQNASLPKLDIDDIVSFKYPTDYFLEDGTYFRLKTIQLGYTVPTELTNKIKIQQLRIYIQAQNLFTITDFRGLDPDAAFSGATGINSSFTDLQLGVYHSAVPSPKQILLGVNLSF